ncbi:MAG: AraC family transcriptional regulator [Bacteroidales bacterium]|nr:AraC family transcriptional regulator [Bacteroidales bacterium]
MRKVTANDFQEGKWMDYSADGIRIINDVRQVTRPNLDAVTIDMIVVNICVQGKAVVTIDGKKHTLSRNKLLILLPNSIVGSYKWSDDFDCKALVFSLKNIENGVYLCRKIWNDLSYLRQHPVVPLNAEDLQVFRYYYGIATSHITADPVYRHEIICNLIKSLIYQYLLITDRFLTENKQNGNMNSNDELFRRFLELLAFSQGRMRKVAQYAEQLCVTPKQLSAAVKAVSGRTAIDWITENTVKSITNELLYTQKSASKIAGELDFPTISFFGKFFKQHTGFSPRAYREKFGDRKK